MKRKVVLLISMILLTLGCGKVDEDKLIKSFRDSVEESESYIIEGKMEVSNDEDTFIYSLEVNHKKDDYYKVALVNDSNGHEQIILKNEDGVYVITPSLNKSFKFQSEWPASGSQAYLLGSILNDILNDENLIFEELDDYYVLEVSVNYPNNAELVYQRVYFDKDMNLKKVEVYNNSDVLKIKVDFNKIDLKENLSEEDFAIENFIDENCCGEVTEQSGAIEDIIYPLYVPTDTYLTSKEIVDIGDKERAILTFAGEKNFVLVEEVSKSSSEFEIIPVYGDPLMLDNTIAALSANSLTWTANNIDYYLVSEDLNSEELMTIASSLNNTDLIVGK